MKQSRMFVAIENNPQQGQWNCQHTRESNNRLSTKNHHHPQHRNSKLTTAHGSFAGENIYLKTRIDGVAQADGDPIFSTVKPGSPVSINQSLFVNSELRLELFTQDIAGDIKIGEATLTVNNQYTPGLETVPLIGNGAVYVLKLEKK